MEIDQWKKWIGKNDLQSIYTFIYSVIFYVYIIINDYTSHYVYGCTCGHIILCPYEYYVFCIYTKMYLYVRSMIKICTISILNFDQWYGDHTRRPVADASRFDPPVYGPLTPPSHLWTRTDGWARVARESHARNNMRTTVSRRTRAVFSRFSTHVSQCQRAYFCVLRWRKHVHKSGGRSVLDVMLSYIITMCGTCSDGRKLGKKKNNKKSACYTLRIAVVFVVLFRRFR